MLLPGFFRNAFSDVSTNFSVIFIFYLYSQTLHPLSLSFCYGDYRRETINSNCSRTVRSLHCAGDVSLLRCWLTAYEGGGHARGLCVFSRPTGRFPSKKPLILRWGAISPFYVKKGTLCALRSAGGLQRKSAKDWTPPPSPLKKCFILRKKFARDWPSRSVRLSVTEK